MLGSYLRGKKMAEKARETILMNCKLSAWSKPLNCKNKQVNSSEVVEKLEKKKRNSVLYELQCQGFGSGKSLVSANKIFIGASSELQN